MNINKKNSYYLVYFVVYKVLILLCCSQTLLCSYIAYTSRRTTFIMILKTAIEQNVIFIIK